MYFLSGQTMTVELDAAHTTTASEYILSYRDFYPSPGKATQVGTTNGTTPVTIISDPSSAQRILTQLTLYNKDTVPITATFKMVVSAVGYRLYKARIPVGGTAIYVNAGHASPGRPRLSSGWCIRDRRGQILQGAGSAEYVNFFQRPTGRKSSSSQALVGTGSPQIIWVGQASRNNFTTCEYVFRVTTAATVVTWSEIALCTAKPILFNAAGMAPDGLIPFIPRGYADLTVPIASTGIKTGSFAVSGIEPGDDMFLAISTLSTTGPTVRSGEVDNTYCHMWGSGNTGLRFSTQLNIPYLAEPADVTQMIEMCAHIF